MKDLPVRQLTFRQHFLAKLNLIRRRYKSLTRTAKKIGVDRRIFARWLSDKGPVTPRATHAKRIDELYAIEFERLAANKRRENTPETNTHHAKLF
jgi:hypothetical protein